MTNSMQTVWRQIAFVYLTLNEAIKKVLSSSIDAHEAIIVVT